MKRLLTTTIIFSLAFFMIQCGDGGSTGATNKYIGEAPGIAQSSVVKIAELESEGKNVTDFNDLAEISKELETAKKETESKIDELAKTLQFPIEVPFEGDFDNEEYTINKLTITDVRYNEIEIQADLTSKVTRDHIFGYLQALDADGNPLLSNKDWAVLAVNNWRDLKEGETAIMKGYFRGLEKLENLEKFIFHPRSEYEKYK